MSRAPAPAAGFAFDVAPAPPQRPDGERSSMYPGALSHDGALRRACLDPQLAARAIPAHWAEDDDPLDVSQLVLCGVTLSVPKSFEEDPVLRAYERNLDKVESKFRAGRKDKSVGGELGSIIIKKKVIKSRKGSSGKTSSAYGQSSMGASGTNGSLNGLKRPASFGAMGERGAKRSKDEFDVTPAPQAVDHTAAYRAAVKSSELMKMAKARTNQISAQVRMSKGIATACARESRKMFLRSIRVVDEANRRARRILRDVLSYWRREDKDRQEERKKLMARAEEHRRNEADEREAQRQKNKLKFLLGQSEAFSTFLKAKTKATQDEAKGAQAAAEDGGSKDDATLPKPAGMSGITGAEDDEELKRIAAINASELVAAHQARIKKFDAESKERKSAALAASAKLEEDRAAVRDALQELNGVSEAEKQAVVSEIEAQAAANSKIEPRVPVEELEISVPGDGKPEVAPVRQPSILNCKMKDYQLRGLAWLVSLYDQGINGILADEMGLGKTLQTISFLAYLCENQDNWGPFLVVSPKATLHNWQQEVTRFCPELKVLPYWGNKNDRNELRKYWSHKRMYRRDSEFQVCITSYETLTVDEKYFHRVKWQYLVLDEAQAIKNSSSSRWKALLQFPCRNRLLLTGTPLQNKLSELWSLLHFIMPNVFDSHAEFADWFAKDIEGHAKNNKILDAATLSRLRTLLDPFMLRRVKRDVESEMPPKTEVQVPCPLAARQRQLYASIKSNISVEELIRVAGSTGGPDGDRNSKLMNIVMQLRKVCNHPETFQRRVPQAPFQFQAVAPPSHVPHPPAILVSSSFPVPPLDIMLLTRSEVVLVVPRSLTQVSDALAYRQHMLTNRFGLWFPEKLRALMYGEDGGGLSIVRLCGGLSVSEASSALLLDKPMWSWRSYGATADDELTKLYSIYDAEEYRAAQEPLDRPHRLLLRPRGSALRRRSSQIVLPGHQSPAQLVERNTRLLKSGRVFIPAAVAPSPELYTPGDASQITKTLSPEGALPYPGMPRLGATYSSTQVYNGWRELLGNYGAHVGTAPLQMPEAGRLIADSGKMKVLDPLLRRLKSEGHKCLIYSQFTRVLDILEDYCAKTAFKFVRLDGQSALADRRDIVAEWQTNDELFVFLLSTRAGGVGLNLTAADTVIFFDSDWNPTQDLQAMDRAHRLGQERPVTVYRLLSLGTIEERMLIRAQQKSRINDLVIKGGKASTEVEEPKDTEIDDIAALLMGEEELANMVNVDEAIVSARNAARLVQEMRGSHAGALPAAPNCDVQSTTNVDAVSTGS